LVIAELDQQRFVAKSLNDGAHLPARKTVGGNIRQQSHHVQKRG